MKNSAKTLALVFLIIVLLMIPSGALVVPLVYAMYLITTASLLNVILTYIAITLTVIAVGIFNK